MGTTGTVADEAAKGSTSGGPSAGASSQSSANTSSASDVKTQPAGNNRVNDVEEARKQATTIDKGLNQASARYDNVIETRTQNRKDAIDRSAAENVQRVGENSGLAPHILQQAETDKARAERESERLRGQSVVDKAEIVVEWNHNNTLNELDREKDQAWKGRRAVNDPKLSYDDQQNILKAHQAQSDDIERRRAEENRIHNDRKDMLSDYRGAKAPSTQEPDNSRQAADNATRPTGEGAARGGSLGGGAQPRGRTGNPANAGQASRESTNPERIMNNFVSQFGDLLNDAQREAIKVWSQPKTLNIDALTTVLDGMNHLENMYGKYDKKNIPADQIHLVFEGAKEKAIASKNLDGLSREALVAMRGAIESGMGGEKNSYLDSQLMAINAAIAALPQVNASVSQTGAGTPGAATSTGRNGAIPDSGTTAGTTTQSPFSGRSRSSFADAAPAQDNTNQVKMGAIARFNTHLREDKLTIAQSHLTQAQEKIAKLENTEAKSRLPGLFGNISRAIQAERTEYKLDGARWDAAHYESRVAKFETKLEKTAERSQAIQARKDAVIGAIKGKTTEPVSDAWHKATSAAMDAMRDIQKTWKNPETQAQHNARMDAKAAAKAAQRAGPAVA